MALTKGTRVTVTDELSPNYGEVGTIRLIMGNTAKVHLDERYYKTSSTEIRYQNFFLRLEQLTEGEIEIPTDPAIPQSGDRAWSAKQRSLPSHIDSPVPLTLGAVLEGNPAISLLL